MDTISLVRDLCNVYSPTGLSARDGIAQICSAAVPGAALVTRPSASPGADGDIVISKKGSGRQKILLLGHYDTVPGSEHIREDGDLLWGLGSYDMKGGLAIGLTLLHTLPLELFASIEMYILGDEEWRTRPPIVDGTWDKILAFEGGEPGGLATDRCGAGSMSVEILSSPQRATWPLIRPSPLGSIKDLFSWVNKSNSEFCHWTPALLDSDSEAINVVSGRVTLRGVLRYHSEASRRQWMGAWPNIFGGCTAQVKFQERIPPLVASKETLCMLSNLQIERQGRSGASDISFLSGRASILVDGLGPLGGGDHSPEEFIEKSSIERQMRIAREIVTYSGAL